MASRRERRQESDSVVEQLRIARTELTQDEFCVKSGIARATYHRWIKGLTEPKLTPSQFKAMAKLLRIESVQEFPDDFGRPSSADSQESSSTENDRTSE